MEKQENKTYQQQRKPSSEFKARKEYLNHELEIMAPKRWRLNLPKRDFNFEIEDIVPAISGTIGKIVMTTAIVSAFAIEYGLPPEFVTENVRFELFLVALLFVIPISGFINPRANLPGCHGPMIPLIPLIVLAGGHPLALGVLVGVLGLILGIAKGGSRLVNLTGTGVRGGLLIVFGMIGIMGQLTAFRSWSVSIEMEIIFPIIMLVTLLSYTYLARIGMRWVAIPLCSLLALVIGLVMGAPFEFRTTPGIPTLNPLYWWGTDTGWMLGLPNLEHFIAVLPFAILAIAMWPPDFLGHRVFQEMNYPSGAKKVLMDVDDTTIMCSIRQFVGSVLGGGNLASSWGTYMIPAGVAKRPIPAGAILTGIFCFAAILIGYPMDIAVWPPVLRVALIVGVFLPLLVAGMQMIREVRHAEAATVCVLGSVLVNPVFGWALGILVHNSGMLGDAEHVKALRRMDRIAVPLITFLICTVAMAVTGKIPGIPGIL